MTNFDSARSYFSQGQNRAQAPDYTDLSGPALLSNRDAINDVRSYYTARGETFSSTEDMWDRFYTDRRWRDSNTVSMALGAAEYALAGDGQELEARLSKLWANAPSRGSAWEKVWDYGTASIVDPVNLIGGYGVAAKGAQAANAARLAGSTSARALTAGARAGAMQGARTEGLVNFGVGAGFDAAQQATELQQGVSDQFSVGRTLASGALDATLGGVIGAGIGYRGGRNAASEALDWTRSSNLGNDLASRATTLERQITEVDRELSASTDPAVRKDLEDEILDLREQRARFDRVRTYVGGLNAQIDDVAAQVETALSRDPSADVAGLRQQFKDLYDQYSGLTARKVADVSDAEIGFAAPARPQQAAPQAQTASQQAPQTPATPQAATPQAATPQAATPQAATPANPAPSQAATPTAAAPKAAAPVEQPAPVAVVPSAPVEAATAAPSTPTAAAAPVDPQSVSISFASGDPKRAEQYQKYLEQNSDVISESDVKGLVASGRIALTPTGNMPRNTMSVIRQFVKEKKAGGAATQAPMAPTQSPEPPVRVSTGPDVPPATQAAAPVPMTDDEVNQAAEAVFRGSMEATAGVKNRWQRIRNLTLPTLRKNNVDPRVQSRVKEMYDMAEQFSDYGDTIKADATYADLRQKFLERNQTVADTAAGGTAPRSAGNTAKASAQLEEGPVTAGRTYERRTNKATGETTQVGRTQGIIRPGYNTDATGERTVLSIADIPSVAKFNIDAAKARADLDAKAGNQKSAYPFTATGVERVVDRAGPKGGYSRAIKGETLYYVPQIKKAFTNPDNVAKALGLDAGYNAKGVSNAVAPNPERPKIATATELVSEKEAAFARFDATGDSKQLEADVAEIEARAGIDDAPKPEAPKAKSPLPEGVPTQRGDMVIAFIPRDPNFDRIRIIGKNQIEAGATAQSVLGRQSPADYYVGYVPAEARKVRGDREQMLRLLDPLDNSNLPEGRVADAPEADANAAPPVEVGNNDVMVDLDLLDNEQLAAFRTAAGVLAGSTDQAKKFMDAAMKKGGYSFDGIYNILQNFESSNWTMNIAGGKAEAPIGVRLKVIAGLNSILNDAAPQGYRLPTQAADDAIQSVNVIFADASSSTRKNLSTMLGRVLQGREGPIFFEGRGPSYTPAARGETTNVITLKPTDAYDLTAGFGKGGGEYNLFTEEFTVAHELGHWAYRNLMNHADRAQFWKAISKFYDENGFFIPKALNDIYERSPHVQTGGDVAGATNALKSPQEYFANQFALWLHHRHDMVLWPDKSFWDKMTSIVSSLWAKLSNKQIVDPDLEPIFDKLLTNRQEQVRVQWTMPKEPNTQGGMALRARYNQVQDAFLRAKDAFADENHEVFVTSMNDLGDILNGMTISEKSAKFAAWQKKEAYRPYSGPLRAIPEDQRRALQLAYRQIKRFVKEAEESVFVSDKGDDVPIMGKAVTLNPDFADFFQNPEFGERVQKLLDTINEAYIAYEAGDIPEFRASPQMIDIRQSKGGMGVVRKTTAYKRLMKKQAAARNRTVAQTKAMMDAAGKKFAETADDAAPADIGFVPHEADMPTALREFSKQIGADGKPTKIGKALTRRVLHLIQSEPAIPTPSSRPFIKLNKYELALRYASAFDRDEKDVMQQVAYEMQQKSIRKDITNGKVSEAIETELNLNYGVPSATAIPANATFKLRSILRAITHRDEIMSGASRTVAARLIYLGHQFNPSKNSEEFRAFRNEVRQIAANLSKNDDIRPAIMSITRMVLKSDAIDASRIDAVRRGAAEYGYDADEFVARSAADSMDFGSPDSFTKEAMSRLRRVRGSDLDDAIADIRNDVNEAVSYVMNGLIASKAARTRFFPATIYGDMSAVSSRFDGTSPKARFAGEVPGEFAVDYARDVMASMTPAASRAVRRFVGGDAAPYFISGNGRSNLLSSGIDISSRPEASALSLRDAIIESIPEGRRQNAELIADLLADTRNNINNLRAKGASPERIDFEYTKERAIVAEIKRLGGDDPTMVRAVFVRDINPVRIAGRKTLKDQHVQFAINAIKAFERGNNVGNAARVLDGVTGLMEPEAIFQQLVDAAGGERNLTRALRDAGHTSLQIGSRKSILDARNIREVRAPQFMDELNEMGATETASDIVPHLFDEALNGDFDLGAMSVSEALEVGGVPKRFLDVVNRARSGGSAPTEADAVELRKTGKWSLIKTNAEVLRKTNMEFMADFWEPANGAGGHFERVNSNMGRFIIPLARSLRNLPDAGNMFQRWFRNGIVQMFDATPGSSFAKEILGFAPTARGNQPRSHAMIVAALRNEAKAVNLTQNERAVYDQVRGYLGNALKRLREAGIEVGNISKNYFPQVWRKDLIEANREAFEDMLTKYFMAESEAISGITQRISEDGARAAARRVAEKLIQSDGVLTGDPLAFRDRSSSGAIAKEADHTDFQRMIRLDKFPEFADPTRPGSNLAQFLENDLMVVMTKYADNVEHRLDITSKFGVGAHGMHDYLATLSGGGDAIARLLSSGKVLKKNYKTMLRKDGLDPQAVIAEHKRELFHPPFSTYDAAMQKAIELVNMAQNGATKGQLKQTILDLVATASMPTDEANRMRRNFAFRAEAIASALVETKGFKSRPETDALTHAEGLMNATLRKPVDGKNGLYDVKAASKWLRSVNAVTLLGFTTLSSLGDVILPLVRSGDFMAYQEALRNFMSDPVAGSAYRDMIRNIGAATENHVHQRMTKAFGVDNTKFTGGFFTATMLTPWTDMMRDISAAVAYEHFRAQARIAVASPNTKQGRIARRILDGYGLDALYKDSSLDLERVISSNGSIEPHPYYHTASAAVIKFTNQTIFTPNANDLPLWAQTPVGAVVFQLKSFPLMMTRLGRDLVREARGPDPRLAPLAYFLGLGPMFGFGVTTAKDVVQGRGGEENREFAIRDRALTDKFTLVEELGLSKDMDMLAGWYLDGIMTMGGLGLIGQLFYDSAAQLDNGAYGQVRMSEMFLGPSMGLFNDAITVAAGAQDALFDALGAESSNAKERSAVREAVGRVPIFGQITAAREWATDQIAGMAEK